LGISDFESRISVPMDTTLDLIIDEFTKSEIGFTQRSQRKNRKGRKDLVNSLH
jgi:hypothetical protein